ncbi:MAG: acyltransferase [Bacteroides sp.]|nr:acyltransferase [Bacteroides sp.]
MNTQTTYLASKPHYEILDGLRGVAAMMVIVFHLFEAHSGGNHLIQLINHGYLAVDFFFMLSGFVIGYAYDDRWKKMTLGTFFKRRIIRLHPMVIMGSIIGAALFFFQSSPCYPAMHDVKVSTVLWVMLLGATLLPLPVNMDIRGWTEMHPLNGPAWSLYYEYIANILYGLFIRRFSKTMLSILVFLAACATLHLCLTAPSGDIVGGWSLTWEQQYVGFVRLTYPFFAGLLLSRFGKLIHIKRGAFWVCSLFIVVILIVPRIGGADAYWTNGLYEAFCIICLFPLIVSMGAGGNVTGKSARVCKFLGDLSYPIYITHYPLIYVYTAYVCNHHLSITDAIPYMVLTVIGAIVLAYACLKLYDEPVREWLKKRFLMKKKAL